VTDWGSVDGLPVRSSALQVQSDCRRSQSVGRSALSATSPRRACVTNWAAITTDTAIRF